MTQAVIDYANELYKTGMSKDFLADAKDTLDLIPQIRADFENPTIELEKKHTVIDKVFPKEVRNFLIKTLL